MKYVVIINHCGFKGSERRCKYFASLKEAWEFYKNYPVYYYAGNDYSLVEKPYLIEYTNKENGYNSHHFYTNEWSRITKEHNLKNGYVYSEDFGWIRNDQTIVTAEESNLFPDFEDIPF